MWRVAIKLVAFVLFFAYGQVLTSRAQEHLLQPHQIRWRTLMLDDSHFDDIGKQLRRKTVRYYNVGIVVLAAVFFLI